MLQQPGRDKIDYRLQLFFLPPRRHVHSIYLASLFPFPDLYFRCYWKASHFLWMQTVALAGVVDSCAKKTSAAFLRASRFYLHRIVYESVARAFSSETIPRGWLGLACFCRSRKKKKERKRWGEEREEKFEWETVVPRDELNIVTRWMMIVGWMDCLKNDTWYFFFYQICRSFEGLL